MQLKLILPLFLSLSSLCCAQVITAPSGSTPSTPATPNASDVITDEILKLITVSQKVPAVCVNEILTDPIRSLGFNSSPLCATYLALSSPQFKQFAAQTRTSTAKSLLSDPAIQAAAIKALKYLSQQTGSSVGTGGSTNLASKGVTSQFLSLASEFGALTESTSGQTTTLAGTLAGVPLVLLKDGLLESCPTNIYGLLGRSEGCASPKLIETLSRISYSVGVNSNTGSQAQSAMVSTTSTAPAVPAVFSNSGSTLSVTAVAAKWIALQGKPSSDAVTAGYKQFTQSDVVGDARGLATKIQDMEPFIDTPDEIKMRQFRNETAKAILKPLANLKPPYSKEVIAQAVQAWKESAPEFVSFFDTPQNITKEEAALSPFLIAVQQFAIAYAKTIAQEQAIGLAMARPAILTFEYDNNRPLNQPSNSAFRVIYQAKLGQVTLTANGAASIYDSPPSASIPGAQRLRDVQFAAEADRTFSPTIPIVGKTSMTGSGSFYFQDQTSPSILNVTPGMPVSGVSFTGLPSTATQVFAQKGKIAIGQAKLTLGSVSNLKVPISVTYSNRTELVTSPVWRAQIGISYDFDSLFTKK